MGAQDGHRYPTLTGFAVADGMGYLLEVVFAE